MLTSFIALIGMRGPGLESKEIYDTMLKPPGVGIGQAPAWCNRLDSGCAGAERGVKVVRGTAWSLDLAFHLAVNRAPIAYREPILDLQLVQERVAGAATDLFASTCVLSRGI